MVTSHKSNNLIGGGGVCVVEPISNEQEFYVEGQLYFNQTSSSIFLNSSQVHFNKQGLRFVLQAKGYVFKGETRVR